MAERPEIAAAREAATVKMAAEYAAARGREPNAQDRLTVFRGHIQGMDHFSLLQYLGDDWNPPVVAPPSASGATEQQCLEWLNRNRPDLGAAQRLAEVRKMVGKGLPRESGEYVDGARHREDKEARKQEAMRQHIAERREHIKQFEK